MILKPADDRHYFFYSKDAPPNSWISDEGKENVGKENVVVTNPVKISN